MTDSMKIYYYESETWTQLTGIIGYPNIMSRINAVGTATIIVSDFEGALYATWSTYNFTPIRIDDASGNVLFRGYCHDKRFEKDKLVLSCSGLAVLLNWKEFNKNYILAEGLVSEVPSTSSGIETTGYCYPNGDAAQAWSHTGAAGWSEIDEAGEPNWDDRIYADSNDDGKVDTYDMTTLTDVISISQIQVKIHGYMYNGATDDLRVNVYCGGWLGEKSDNIPVYPTLDWDDDKFIWSGLSLTQADLNGLQVKITAPADIQLTEGIAIDAIRVEITYDQSGYTIELTDDDDGVFSWDDDYWINDQDVGLLIVDTSGGFTTRNWICKNGGITTNQTYNSGDYESTHTKNDGDTYLAHSHYDNTQTVSIDINSTEGPSFDIDIAHTIQSIKVNYKIGHGHSQGDSNSYLYFQVYNGSSWVNIFSPVYKRTIFSGSTSWYEGTIELSGTLTDYLNDSNADDDYDELQGLRIILDPIYCGAGAAPEFRIYVDYINVEIKYTEDAVSPIMESITSNDDTSVSTSGLDHTSSGIQIGDSFKIGENTTKILDEISVEAGVGFRLDSSLSKYISRHYKGTSCMEALNSVCALEGLFWFEDYENNIVVISKEDDFEDSGVDLTQSDYDVDWRYEDHCNNYFKIKVFGNASYNIQAAAPDLTVDSLMTKQIIDESIMTIPDAQEVADTQLAIWKTKRPSIYLKLHGTNAALMAGKTVGITMARPTVAAADYVIRRLERYREGEHIKTKIYAGLGSTPEEERLANNILKGIFGAHKAHTDRLISTPWTGGASINADDIGGLTAAIQAASINNTVIDDDTMGTATSSTLSSSESIKAYVDNSLAAQHDRILTPSDIGVESGWTSGNNNCYRSTGSITFGKDSKTNNAGLRAWFTLPDEYVAGENITLNIDWQINLATPNTVDYSTSVYLARDGTFTFIDSNSGTWTASAVASKPTFDTDVITGTNLQARDDIYVRLLIEDTANNLTTQLNTITLTIPVNERD